LNFFFGFSLVEDSNPNENLTLATIVKLWTWRLAKKKRERKTC
jgi:hypothetical protein